MTSNCQSSSAGAYAPKHELWPYWTDATGQANCSANDVPLGTTTSGNRLNDINSGNLPVTGEITPNLNNDAHAGTGRHLAPGMAPDHHGWTGLHLRQSHDHRVDEDDSSPGNNVQFVAIDPRLSHVVFNGTFNHYSLTRWLDDNAGVPLLRNASSAPDLRTAFGL